MDVLIDTNIAINFITKRSDPQLEAIIDVMRLCANDEVNGYLAFHSLSIIWYVLRKTSDEKRREYLKELCNILRVTGAPHDDIVKAIEQIDFKDFEDCLQDKCAINVTADYIITCNIKDFAVAETPAITPIDFLNKINQ